MAKMKFRTVYSAREEEHKGILFSQESLAQQHFRDECDVNMIVDRYVKTGVMEHLADVPPHYADVSEIPTDLISAYDAVYRAENAFMDLPSDLRKSLNNDPSRLGEWLSNPENKASAVKFGLLNETVLSTNTNVEANEVSKDSVKPSEPASVVG